MSDVAAKMLRNILHYLTALEARHQLNVPPDKQSYGCLQHLKILDALSVP